MHYCETHTFLYLQRLTWIDFHLHLPISLVLTEPAVTGEHVLHPVHRDPDLNAVQEPTSSQALVSVANQHPVYLQDPPRKQRGVTVNTHIWFIWDECEFKCSVQMYEWCLQCLCIIYIIFHNVSIHIIWQDFFWHLIVVAFLTFAIHSMYLSWSNRIEQNRMNLSE